MTHGVQAIRDQFWGDIQRFHDSKERVVFELWLGDDWVGGDDELIDSGRLSLVNVNEAEFMKLRRLLRLGAE